jgi:hypothetical protein
MENLSLPDVQEQQKKEVEQDQYFGEMEYDLVVVE